MRSTLSILLTTVMISGCATTGPTRIMIGAGFGATAGAAGGNLLSPNDESRGVNALVFGLAGALVGGLVALITDTRPPATEGKPTLKDRDLSLAPGTRDYVIPSDQKLPAFVRERLQPIVIEQTTEPDTVSEDGTLHEPHKIYRIIRSGELYANPAQTTKLGESK